MTLRVHSEHGYLEAGPGSSVHNLRAGGFVYVANRPMVGATSLSNESVYPLQTDSGLETAEETV